MLLSQSASTGFLSLDTEERTKKNILPQLSALQTRQARIQKLRKQIEPSPEELSGPLAMPETNSEYLWYFIGKSQNQPLNLGHLIRTNYNDLAFAVSSPAVFKIAGRF
jgi:hypothetical protein